MYLNEPRRLRSAMVVTHLGLVKWNAVKYTISNIKNLFNPKFDFWVRLTWSLLLTAIDFRQRRVTTCANSRRIGTFCNKTRSWKLLGPFALSKVVMVSCVCGIKMAHHNSSGRLPILNSMTNKELPEMSTNFWFAKIFYPKTHHIKEKQMFCLATC